LPEAPVSTHPLARLVALACRRPWTVVMVALALTLAAIAFAASHFAMTTDASALISPRVDWRQNEKRMDAAFPQNGDSVLVVVDGETPELAEQAAAGLAAKMTADTAHFRRVSRPDGGDYFAREGLLFGSEAEVAEATRQMVSAQPFLGPLAGDPSLRGIATTLDTMLRGVERGDARLADIDKPMAALADALDRQAAGRPAFFSWQALFGAGGQFAAPKRRLVLATPVLDYGNLMPGEPATEAVRGFAQSLHLDAAHGTRVRITGSAPLSDEEFASLADHVWLVAGTMILAMLATLWLAMRSWRIVTAILVTTLAGLAVTTGIGIAAVGALNLISVAFIPLFVGLGVDFGIQLGVRFQAERLERDAAAAMAAAATALAGPLTLAAGAVCLGFLAFLPTDYVGVSELGVIAGLGMIVALALSATLLPALLMLLKPGRPRAELANPALAPADAFLLRKRGLVLGLFVLAMALSIVSLFWVRFDFNPLHLRNPSGEAMATLADLKGDNDPNTIDILAPSLKAADALAAKLSRLPEVGRAITASSLVPEDQAPKLAQIQNAQALLDFSLNPIMPALPPSDAETVAALRATAANLGKAAAGTGTGTDGAANDARRLAAAFDRLAAGPPAARAKATALLIPPLTVMLDQIRNALAAQPVTVDNLPDAVKQDWIARTGQARVQLSAAGTDRSDKALARFVRAVRAVAPAATGTAVSTQAAARTVAGAFVEAGALALVLVSLLLLAVLRSVREVAFTLAPVVLSGFLTLGTCVLIGQPINFANIIAFPLLFGVGVAFHIYFVMAWRAGATDLLQSPLARAVFFSALATGSAFGALWLSRHPGTASMGKILMLSLAWTLVCALIFEPALLGPQRKHPSSP
jgi:uncharacterized protein